MRIGVCCYPTFGGSGVVASELALAMAQRGHEVHVLSYALPPRLAHLGDFDPGRGVRFHEVRVMHYPLFEYPPYSLALATKLVDVARHHGLDLVHVHYAVPNAVSALLARSILAPQKLAVVTTLHGTDVTLVGNDPSYLETTRFGVRESDAVTAVSEWLRHKTIEQLHIDRPIEVVPNFVDMERFPLRERPLGEPPVVIHVSNFRGVKRVADVLEVFARVRRERDCRLVLLGDGPERAPLEERCRGAWWGRDVQFFGEVDDVVPELLAADLFLLPSSQESFGLAALEAMAAGLPVVATRVGGLAEGVVDDSCGELFEVGDVVGMANASRRILEEGDRFAALSKGARRRAEQYSIDEITGRYEAIYRSVL